MLCDCGLPCHNTYALVDDNGRHPICPYCFVELLPDVEEEGGEAVILRPARQAVTR